MRTETVTFYSEGCRMGGILRSPDAPREEPGPAVVQGPGWMGLKDAKLYERYHQALTDAGYLVLAFDYRGFGDSEGERDLIHPLRQVEDWRNAITYMRSRPDVSPQRIGAFGTGGTGGGNAVYVAAVDERVRCVVCQVGIADGEDWLHRMRREHEWVAFLARLEADRARRVREGESELVNPKEEIMIATPERKASNVKQDVDARVPSVVRLRSADAIIEYKPIEVVERISPRALMLIAVDPDAVTPFDHSVRLFERAGPPKRLVVQRQTSHYSAYDDYHAVVTPMIVEWFDRHMGYGSVEVIEDIAPGSEVVHPSAPAPSRV
jgi:dipeptidyl aminopeptidase/acylaminoacyl peptidase